MVQGLVAAGSALVSQNPAGWLRRAIEEDYSLPRNSQRHHLSTCRRKKDNTPAQAVPEKQHVPKEEPKLTQNVPTEQRKPQKTSRENKTIWQKTLENLQEVLPPEESVTRLTGTTLLEVTDTAAWIGVPNATTIAWLERRLYGQIAKAIKGVLGRELDLQFVTAPGF
jgi:hypothetical protein